MVWDPYRYQGWQGQGGPQMQALSTAAPLPAAVASPTTDIGADPMATTTSAPLPATPFFLEAPRKLEDLRHSISGATRRDAFKATSAAALTTARAGKAQASATAARLTGAATLAGADRTAAPVDPPHFLPQLAAAVA